MAETIAHPESPTLGKALGRGAQLIRLLEEAGLSQGALQKPIDDPECRRELVIRWEAIANTTVARAPGTSAEAAQIMGDNFHGLTAVKKHLGFKLGRSFEGQPFSAEVLQTCKDTHVLVAAPTVSIMDVHGKAPQAFYSRSNPWYGERQQQFARDKIESGWYLVRKDGAPDSPRKHWNDQQAMVQPPDFVPAANLAAYAWVLHFLATGERMFSRVWARTDSLAADGGRVGLIGDVDGLHLDYWNDGADSIIGVASARKPG